MYPVSEKYIAACRASFKEERITGGIKLIDGTIIPIDDSVVVQGSLCITSKVCSSNKFDIGTANCSEMSIKIRDKRAYDHEFGGALIKLTYGLVVDVADDGSKTWEEVPIPPFLVGTDASNSPCVRVRDMVTLKAYDMMSLLDINYPDTIPTTNMWAALVYVCNRAGIGLAITEDEFNALPNSGVIPDFSSESVETCRDVVMWIAQTVGSCAFCDYRGLLRIKPFKYEGGNTYDRLFTASERTAIEYSDTRTYLAYLQAYVGKDVRQYSKVTTWTGTDAPHIKEGVLSLPQNPIIQKLSESQQETVNQSYFTNRSYPTRYIKATGFVDPALELLDVVAFSGGNIDVGQIINVATQIKWRYHGKGDIYCASVSESVGEVAQGATQSAESVAVVSEVSAEVALTESSDDTVVRVKPRPQSEKQINGGAGNAEKLQTTGSDYWAVTDGSGVCVGKGDTKIAYIGDLLGGIGISAYGPQMIALDSGGNIDIRNSKSGSSQVLINNSGYYGNAIRILAQGDGGNTRFDVAHGSTIELSGTLTLSSAGLFVNGKKVVTED